MLISAHKELTQFLNQPKNLHWLNLSQCHVAPNSGCKNITDDPGELFEMTQLLPRLANAFATASPKNLSIHTRHFDLNAFSAIANALVVPKNRVRTLELSINSPAQGSEITPEMMRVLVEGLKKSPTLRELSLKNHYISSRAAKILAEALPHTNISVCDLTDCGIKKTGLAALLRALPKTKLVYLGMYGSHYRTILKCAGMYGSINLTGSKALRKAVDSETCLVTVELPADHFVFNCRRNLKEGKEKDKNEKSTIKITKMVDEAYDKLKNRLENLRTIAFRLLNDRPLHLNSELVTYMQQGGDQAIRHALKDILFERYQYSFICSKEMDKKLDGLIAILRKHIAHYLKSTNQQTLFGKQIEKPLTPEPAPAATPVFN